MPDTINSATFEKTLQNLLGATVSIANLLKAKEAAELALRGGAQSGHTNDLLLDFVKSAGLSNRDFRDDKGRFTKLNDITDKISKSFKASSRALDGFSSELKQAASEAKKFKEAVNFSYSIGSGKYAAITPFMQQRVSIGKFGDFLSVGAKDLKRRALDPKEDFNKILTKSRIPLRVKAGLGLGRIASGAVAGGGLAGAALSGVAGFVVMQVAKTFGDVFKTAVQTSSLSTGMKARGAGASWGASNLASSMYRLRKMGLSSDNAMQMLTQGQQVGLGISEVESAVAAQQALGISNTIGKASTLKRRFGYHGDISRYFRSLEPITKKTGLSLEELTNASEDLANNFKGVISANGVRGLMSRYGDLVRTKAFIWGEIAGLANTTQGLPFEQQMAVAHFASAGGYKFKHGSLLGRAYEMQRSGPSNIDKNLAMYRAAVTGMLGGAKWGSLSDEQKYIYGNKVLSQFGLADFYRNPQGEELMNRLMQGGSFTEKEKKEWIDASHNDTQKIAEKMALIQNPLDNINVMLAGWVSSMSSSAISSGVKSLADLVVSDYDKKKIQLNVNTFSNVPDVGLKIELPGEPSEVYSEANK